MIKVALVRYCGRDTVCNEETGDFLLVLPLEYCGTSSNFSSLAWLGRTAYGVQINGYCQEFVRPFSNWTRITIFGSMRQTKNLAFHCR